MIRNYSFPFLIRDANLALGMMRQNLLIVARWCCERGLLVNPSKTKFLIIGTRPLQRIEAIEPSIPFLGENLNVAAFAGDLGVILDPVLSYDEHITKLVSICMSKLCQISWVEDCFNEEILKLIIESLILRDWSEYTGGGGGLEYSKSMEHNF